jgi:hypothetical protein
MRAELVAAIADMDRTVAQRSRHLATLGKVPGHIAGQNRDEFRPRKQLTRVDRLDHSRRHAGQDDVIADGPDGVL